MSKQKWPVIDTHCFVGVNPRSSFIAEEELIPYMNANNIDIQIIFQVDESYCHRTPDWNPYLGNDYIAKIQKSFPDRVIGLATINPWFFPPKIRELPYSKRGEKIDVVKRYIAMEELERAIIDLDLNGLRIHSWAQNCAVNNPTLMFPLMKRLVELQKEKKKKFLVVAHGAGDSLYNSPEAFAQIALEFPELLFIMGHSGFIWGMGTISNLANINNLFLDLTCVTTPHAIMGYKELAGIEKMTIGSYFPYATPTTKLTLLDDMLFTNDKEKDLVLGGNIANRLEIKMKDS